jgi:hypothetical protein
MTTAPYPAGAVRARPALDAERLWSGGVATAVVAAATALVGFLIARGLFGIPVLAPAEDGAWGTASVPAYALAAAGAALLATAILHLLIAFTPTPYLFFGWLMGLSIVAGMVAPFISGAETSAKVATAAINLAIGAAIWSLVASSAGNAIRAAARDHRPPPSAG